MIQSSKTSSQKGFVQIYFYWLFFIFCVQILLLNILPSILTNHERDFPLNNLILIAYLLIPYAASSVIAYIATKSYFIRKLIQATGTTIGIAVGLFGIYLGIEGCFELDCLLYYPVITLIIAYSTILTALAPFSLALDKKPKNLTELRSNMVKPGLLFLFLYIVVLIGSNLADWNHILGY